MAVFKSRASKIIGTGLLAGGLFTAAYFAAEPLGNAVLNSKAYDRWITKEAGKSTKQWFDAYYQTPSSTQVKY